MAQDRSERVSRASLRVEEREEERLPVAEAAEGRGPAHAGPARYALASALVGRHGWLGLPCRPVPVVRLAGVGVLLAGVGLIQIG